VSKAIIVVDFAYRGPKRAGRGGGLRGLHAMLRYLQYRDRRSRHPAPPHAGERWQDRGLGRSHSEVLRRCLALQSQHVLAWTWVISPAPDLMALVPPAQRPALLAELTERVVEDYYDARGFDVPEYSYVLHCARTKAADGQPAQEHLHTHVVLPGTVSSAAERLPVYNNATRGHDRLFREIASRHFAELLDERGIDWRPLREIPAPAPALDA
jgi:hypothetical protein